MPLLAVAIPTFIGSLSSFIATFVVLVLQICFPPKRRHLRHALVFNLLVADCINSFNNTMSGGSVLIDRTGAKVLSDGPLCTLNAWVGQFSVQATDFTILMISIVVLITIRGTQFAGEPSIRNTVLLCALTWIPSIITSNVALGLKAYGPVSGNWCWIRPDLLGLRYALTHAWRIAIFLATICIYTYIYIHLKRFYNGLGATLNTLLTTADDLDQEEFKLPISEQKPVPDFYIVNHGTEQNPNLTPESTDSLGPEFIPQTSKLPGCEVQMASTEIRRPSVLTIRSQAVNRRINTARSRQVKRMLLLNGYPILYIILWIPGIANRIVESIGETPLWLKVLQASTQFVGLADAIFYGWSEQLKTRLQTRWREKREFCNHQHR